MKKEQKTMATEIQIRKPPGAKTLPDNGQWQNRFEIKSESSGRIYIVSQNKDSGKWACSCPAWITRRYCKHLLQGCQLSTSQIHGHGTITSGPGAKGKIN